MTVRLECKAQIEAAGDAGEIEALAWPYNTPDRLGDVIQKNAFGAIALPMPLLFGHDQNDPVGVWDHAEQRDDGLYLKGRLLVADVARAREVSALVKAGAVRGVSIGFITQKAQPQKRGRLISQAQLLECSLVSLPCHPGAKVISAKAAVHALAIAEALNRATAQLSRKGN